MSGIDAKKDLTRSRNEYTGRTGLAGKRKGVKYVVRGENQPKKPTGEIEDKRSLGSRCGGKIVLRLR